MKTVKSASFLLALFALLASASAQSVQSGSKAWDREPSTFFNIKLDAPIELSIHECPKQTIGGRDVYSTQESNTVCYEKVYGTYQLRNQKTLSVTVVHHATGVGMISAYCSSDISPTVLEALIEKFGKPTSLTTETVRSKAGVSYPNTVARWVGKNVFITFNSVGPQVDLAEILVTTGAWRSHERDQERSRVEALKSQF